MAQADAAGRGQVCRLCLFRCVARPLLGGFASSLLAFGAWTRLRRRCASLRDPWYVSQCGCPVVDRPTVLVLHCGALPPERLAPASRERIHVRLRPPRARSSFLARLFAFLCGLFV